jgi:hypothetical protein
VHPVIKEFDQYKLHFVQFHIHDVETLNPFHHREYQNDFPSILCSSPYILNANQESFTPWEGRIMCCGSAFSKVQNLGVSFVSLSVKIAVWQACLQYCDRLTYRNASSR